MVRASASHRASPLPLAFFSFALGMALLGALGLRWLSSAQDVRTAGVLMAAFVFPLETLAAVFALLDEDSAVAATLGLFATSWLGLGLLDALDPTQPTSRTVGVFLAGFAVVLTPLMVIALLGKRVMALVLVCSVLRAGFQAAYELGAPQWTRTADGVLALTIFALATYVGATMAYSRVRVRD